MPELEAALAAIPESERFGIEQGPDGDDDDPSALQAGRAVGDGRYNPSQPRHPRGSPSGGQWSGGGGGGFAGAAAGAGELSAADVEIVRDYTGAGYRSINHPLRNGVDPKPEVKARIERLDAAVAKGTLDADTTLYRGVNKFGADKILAGGTKKGTVITDAGFMSTTRNPTVAKSFQTAAKDNILIRVSAKKGAVALDVDKITSTAGEAEFLFSRNSRLKVVKWDRKNRILDVEPVND